MSDEMLDYNVDTTVHFRLPDMSPEFNALAVSDLRKVFVEHVKSVFEKDETLGDSGYISGPLNFRFSGQQAKLQYVFKCCDESKEEAESFSSYCVRCVKKELEEFGCKVKKIECTAEEADMSWLDRLEDAVFGPRDSAWHPAQAFQQEPNRSQEADNSAKNKKGRKKTGSLER